ncbi:TPA: hypothetical protein ACH3X1_012383 [Trebouxia sp. C0004]
MRIADSCSSAIPQTAFCNAVGTAAGTCKAVVGAGQKCTAGSDACVWGAQCVGAKSDGTASGVCTPIVQAKQSQSSKQASTSGATASKFSTADSVPAVSAVAFLTAYSNINAFNASEKARFVKILETNAYIKTNAITNVTIDKVIMGSINVAHTFAFTAADSTAAVAGQSSLAEVLKSGDAASIFGTSFGPVTVSNVTQQNTTNPTISGAGAVFATWTVVLAAMLTLTAFTV